MCETQTEFEQLVQVATASNAVTTEPGKAD